MLVINVIIIIFQLYNLHHYCLISKSFLFVIWPAILSSPLLPSLTFSLQTEVQKSSWGEAKSTSKIRLWTSGARGVGLPPGWLHRSFGADRCQLVEGKVPRLRRHVPDAVRGNRWRLDVCKERFCILLPFLSYFWDTTAICLNFWPAALFIWSRWSVIRTLSDLSGNLHYKKLFRWLIRKTFPCPTSNYRKAHPELENDIGVKFLFFFSSNSDKHSRVLLKVSFVVSFFYLFSCFSSILIVDIDIFVFFLYEW